MTKEDTIATYFMKISQLKDQLIAIGEIVEDEDLVSTALDGLPPSWENFVSDGSARENQPSFEKLWIDCLQEEGRVMNKVALLVKKVKPLILTQGKGKEGSFPSSRIRREDLLQNEIEG